MFFTSTMDSRSRTVSRYEYIDPAASPSHTDPFMAPKVVWLLTFVGLYWSYCIFWGIKGMRASRTASD